MGIINLKTTKEEKQRMVELYKQGISAPKIARMYNIYPGAVYGNLKRRDVKTRPHTEAHRKYWINENYFDVIDSEEKAYILGLFYADGSNNVKTYSSYIALAEASGTKGKNAVTEKSFYKDHGWDKEIPTKGVFEEMFRISKNQMIFGGNYFVEHLHNSPCWIVWDKNNSSNKFADCELVWTSFKTAVRKIKYTWHGMLQQNMKNKEIRHHPTQKPLFVIKKLINDYSVKGQIICDPFMGSWTTAVAAQELDRDFIGCDMIEEYCKIGEKRLKTVQKHLF